MNNLRIKSIAIIHDLSRQCFNSSRNAFCFIQHRHNMGAIAQYQHKSTSSSITVQFIQIYLTSIVSIHVANFFPLNLQLNQSLWISSKKKTHQFPTAFFDILSREIFNDSRSGRRPSETSISLVNFSENWNKIEGNMVMEKTSYPIYSRLKHYVNRLLLKIIFWENRLDYWTINKSRFYLSPK